MVSDCKTNNYGLIEWNTGLKFKESEMFSYIDVISTETKEIALLETRLNRLKAIFGSIILEYENVKSSKKDKPTIEALFSKIEQHTGTLTVESSMNTISSREEPVDTRFSTWRS